jgi:hypothetical protein
MVSLICTFWGIIHDMTEFYNSILLEDIMNKKEVFEIKARFKKTGCTFTKMSGCYVNSAKEIVVNLNETFLNLEDDEFYKYLDIAKKTLSGNLGNNLLELAFPIEEEEQGGKQQFLMGLRESKLKNEGLLETFYQLIIDSYDYAGNYLILVYHDAYDVMTKTSDNNKLDESEEVYEYLLFSICPVTLTKPALGYLEDENKIGPRNRDWVVGAPDTGFIWPAFMFYTKNPLEPHNELIELVLGCEPKATATEQKNTFHTIIKNVINDSEKTTKVIGEIQESLHQIVEEKAALEEDSDEPVILTKNTVSEILVESGLPEEITAKIETAYEETFQDEPPAIEYILDKKILAENEKNKTTKALVEQIQVLQERLEETTKNAVALTAETDNMDGEVPFEDAESNDSYDVVLRVKDDKMEHIKSQVIDGVKCVIIPIEEDEHVNVNGVTLI